MLLVFLRLFFCISYLVTVFAADQQVLAENARQSNQSLLWGPYRPNLYFGVRPRLPKSLMTGLMWARVDNFNSVQQGMEPSQGEYYNLPTLTDFRHTCEQNEGMVGYGWEEYDARQGGRQTIHDSGNNIDLTTEFVKFPGGDHGGSWAVRVKGTPRADAPERLMTTVIFYTTMEGLGSLEVENELDAMGYEGIVTLKGESAGLGDFKVDITPGPKTNKHPKSAHDSYASKPLDRTLVASLQAPEEVLWQAKRKWTILHSRSDT